MALNERVEETTGRALNKLERQSPTRTARLGSSSVRSACVDPICDEKLEQRQNDQRQRHKCQQNVRGEDRKVEPRDPAGVSGRFLANTRVISDVADQKTNRREQCCDHARHMAAPRAAPNEVPTRGNKNGAYEIERGIERGQVGG
jgi:hypothetical protein